ncbi:unnamed protein product, partial [Polarella glacialis]
KARDVANSEGADPGLVEEMEQAQRRARGEEGGSKANEPVLRQWGEEGARELQSLKRKFLLPFAAERHHPGSAETVLVAWQSPELQSGQIQVPAEYVKDVKQPLCATLEHILAQVVDYVENHFPLELLSTRRDPCLFHAIRECLQSSEFVRLTGLLAHFVYWNAFAHLHAPERQLTASTRQSLVLTAQELWSRASEPARTKLGRKKLSCGPTDSPAGMCFVIPVFLLVLKRGVEEVFKHQYKKFFADADIGAGVKAQLVDQINVTFMNLFDPDCAQVSFGALDSSMEAMKLWRKLHILQMKMGLTPATRSLARQSRPTPMMLLLMNGDGGPADPKTRKLLQKSSSDTVLAAVAGLPPLAEASPLAHGSPRGRGMAPRRVIRPHLDPPRRAMLYRTACSRLSSAGQQAVSAGHRGNQASP